MIWLMYVSSHELRWVDVSLQNLTGDRLRQIVERFTGVNGHGSKSSILHSYASLDDPQPFIKVFFELHVEANT